MRQHSKQYELYLNSFDWYIKKLQVFERAGGRCEMCGKIGFTEVHHKTYKNLGNEPISDLIALCPDCHKLADIQRATNKRQEIYERRLDSWATKVFGEYYQEWSDRDYVEECFQEWLERKGS